VGDEPLGPYMENKLNRQWIHAPNVPPDQRMNAREPTMLASSGRQHHGPLHIE